MKRLFSRFNTPLGSAAIGWLARITSAVSGLCVTRVVIEAVGTSDFGVIVILLGAAGWFALLDLGIGTGIQNLISERRARSRLLDPILLFSGGVIGVYLLMSIVVSLVLALVFTRLGLSHGAHWLVVWIVFLGAAFASIGSVVIKIGLAVGRGASANIIPAIASLSSLVLVFLLWNVFSRSDLVWYVAAIQIIPGLLPLCLIGVFGIPLGRCSRRRFILTYKLVWQRARGFLVFTILGMLVLQVDYFFISKFLTSVDAAQYGLSMKFIGLVGTLCVSSLSTFWPILAEKCARRDYASAVLIGRQLLWFGLFFMLLVVACLYVEREFLFRHILNAKLDAIPTQLLIVAMGFYWILRIWTDVFAVFLQANNAVSGMFAPVTAQAILSLGAIYLLIPSMGIVAIPLGMGLSFLFTVAWLLPLKVLKLVKSGANYV